MNAAAKVTLHPATDDQPAKWWVDLQLANGERYHYGHPQDPLGINSPQADAHRAVQNACTFYAPRLEVLAYGEIGDMFVFTLHEYIPPTKHEHTFTFRVTSEIADRGEALQAAIEALAGYDFQAYEVAP